MTLTIASLMIVGVIGAAQSTPPLEYLSGSFDPAAKAFTIVLPLASVKAKVGSISSPRVATTRASSAGYLTLPD